MGLGAARRNAPVNSSQIHSPRARVRAARVDRGDRDAQGIWRFGGIYMEDAEECSLSPNPAWATQEAAMDLRQAASYLATRPEVDGSRMIGIGLSTAVWQCWDCRRTRRQD